MNNFNITHKLEMLDKQDLEDVIVDFTKSQPHLKLFIIRSIDNKINQSLRGVTKSI